MKSPIEGGGARMLYAVLGMRLSTTPNMIIDIALNVDLV